MNPADTMPSMMAADADVCVPMQTRNNARVVVSGSIALFSNEFIRWSPLIMTPGQRYAISFVFDSNVVTKSCRADPG